MDRVQLEGPGDYIDGRFTAPGTADGEIAVTSPADVEDVLARFAFAHAHADAAVHAARRAFAPWRKLGDAARRDHLRAYQAQLRAHRDTLAQVLSREVGKALWDARTEIDAMIGKVDLALGEGARFTATQALHDLPGEIRYAPLGVCAVLGPFNFPGHLPNGQIVPALLTGNTVVHKPSERTPCTAALIARCMHEAGLPPGVFNVVQGDGAVGAKLAQHDGVDGVLFTGSVEVGRRIAIANAARPDRLLALELGGKNVSVALDDCDVERSARCLAFAAFVSAGQRCTATSRLFVTAGVAERLIARIADIARGLRVGYVLDDVFMGPVISEAARGALLAAQSRARDAGFEAVVSGGACAVDGRSGYYVAPTVARAPSAGAIVPGYSDRELFGPDLAVHVARDEDEALELASRSRYGLAAGVFTQSAAAFERAADALRVGVLCWNRPTAGASGRLPFGGVRESGNHRPAGILAGLTCTDAVGVLLTPGAHDPLPSWPGMRFDS